MKKRKCICESNIVLDYRAEPGTQWPTCSSFSLLQCKTENTYYKKIKVCCRNKGPNGPRVMRTWTCILSRCRGKVTLDMCRRELSVQTRLIVLRVLQFMCFMCLTKMYSVDNSIVVYQIKHDLIKLSDLFVSELNIQIIQIVFLLCTQAGATRNQCCPKVRMYILHEHKPFLLKSE